MVCEIGPVSDALCLFDLARDYAIPSLTEKDQVLILDRLYKRYIRIEETQATIEAMRRLQKILDQADIKNIKLCYSANDLDETRINFHQDTIGEGFKMFLTDFTNVQRRLYIFTINLKIPYCDQ